MAKPNSKNRSVRKTTVGRISAEVLDYTAGRDRILDLSLVEADAIGSAAHAVMLSEMPVRPPVLTRADVRRIRPALVAILRDSRAGRFGISAEDQDVHLAVERKLTQELGDLGRRIHTGRSRNDQVAVDLRLLGRVEILGTVLEAAEMARTLVEWGSAHRDVPMVGRTHQQRAMPSSLGLWATAFSEELLDDIAGLETAYQINDQCPLGAAAGYGVPLPIDRQRVSDLLGFSRPAANVLYAVQSRGKIESIALWALGQVLLTLSRLAQDLILFSLPEFGYFTLPADTCTGSSIMPQKRNPDVLELVRARTARVLTDAAFTAEILRAAPSGYNRDVQESKEPFLNGLATTRSTLRVMTRILRGLEVHPDRLREGFSPDVFATDRALELVGQGMPFRDAYHHVKENLQDLQGMDPGKAIQLKTHLGATAGLDFEEMRSRIAVAENRALALRKRHDQVVSRLLKIRYPDALIG
ncbi:MAG: argininosuccinate lyase [Kiritimatiellia bacterium]|nr:argininosuccinate lyase [Kiritimatiellia bacterium]